MEPMEQVNKEANELIHMIENSDMPNAEKHKHISEVKWELQKEKFLRSNLFVVIISILTSLITALILTAIRLI